MKKKLQLESIRVHSFITKDSIRAGLARAEAKYDRGEVALQPALETQNTVMCCD